MEKKKIDFAKYGEMHEEKQITGEDGTVITARNHIPFTSKVEMAQAVAANVVMLHDDSCTYESHLEEAIWSLNILKYYTDIDTEEVTVADAEDFLVNNEIVYELIEFVGADLAVVEDMYSAMRDGVMITYEDDHSLSKAIKNSFGFLLNGEDVTETLAKAETTGGTLFDAIAALQRENKRNNPGKVNIEGNVLNFAKKK